MPGPPARSPRSTSPRTRSSPDCSRSWERHDTPPDRETAMATVVVSGAIANKYLRGGAVWTRLSYALGFRRLGFRVYFVEQIDPGTCVDASGAASGFEESANLAYFRRVTSQFGLAGVSTLLCGAGEVDGLPL